MTKPNGPFGLACSSVHVPSSWERHSARRFCLEMIKEVYGTDYRPDWHADLDSLAGEAEHSWFSPAERGAFWTVSRGDGGIVATAGIYRLDRKPSLVSCFSSRYPQPETVAQLVRVYVSSEYRGSGIGRWLTAQVEVEARRLDFATLYLHANNDTAKTIAFWQGRGFRAFDSAEGTTHFDKSLSEA